MENTGEAYLDIAHEYLQLASQVSAKAYKRNDWVDRAIRRFNVIIYSPVALGHKLEVLLDYARSGLSEAYVSRGYVDLWCFNPSPGT